MNGPEVLILCTSILCMLMVCSSVAENVHVEYERSGICDVSNMHMQLHSIYSCKTQLLYIY